MMVEAVERAEDAGIFVVSAMDGINYFHGLGRAPYADPNDPSSYGPGSWWSREYYRDSNVLPGETLLFPMDARCTASPTGVEDYVFYRQGGLSWSIPYVAGLYALACQVKPDVTPAQFWAAGRNTGDTIEIVKDNQTFSFGKIVNPVKLIETLSASDK